MVWKQYFFLSVLNFLPFNFVKCLPVLVPRDRPWVMLLITLGWKPDPAWTGKWQICLFGFRSRQGKIAGNRPYVADGSSLAGHVGDVGSPAALLCSRDAAQAAWEPELSGAGLGSGEGARVQALCCQSFCRSTTSLKIPFNDEGILRVQEVQIPSRDACVILIHRTVQYCPWALQTLPDEDFQVAPSAGALSITMLRIQIPVFLIVK